MCEMPSSSSVFLFVLIKLVKTSFHKRIIYFFIIFSAYFVSTAVNFSKLTYLRM